MPNYNFSHYSKIFFNGVEVPKVFFNGALVWEQEAGIDTSITTINIVGLYNRIKWGFSIQKTGTATELIVDWGDGNESLVLLDSKYTNVSHEYTTDRTYIIKITANGTYSIQAFGLMSGSSHSNIYRPFVSSVILGDDITSMPDLGSSSTVDRAINLSYLYIGKNIETINSFGLANLPNLITVDIDPQSILHTIKYQAFYNTLNLKSIWLPATLQNIPIYHSSFPAAAFTGASPDLVIYLEGTVQPGFYEYWNSYGTGDPTKLLTYYENVSYEDYKKLWE